MATDNTVEQLDAYYTLNLQHLRLSFCASLIALFVGLITLLCGSFLVIQGNVSIASQLSIVGGVITEFIGAGFFILYGKNLVQLNVFYEKLIKHKDTLYAISLSREASDSDRADLYKAIIGNLLSRGEPPTPPDILKAIIEREKK